MLANSTALIDSSIRVYGFWQCTSQLSLQRRGHNLKRSHIRVLGCSTVEEDRMITALKVEEQETVKVYDTSYQRYNTDHRKIAQIFTNLLKTETPTNRIDTHEFAYPCHLILLFIEDRSTDHPITWQ